jgi:quinol monooxygenase YgiN
VAARTWSGAVSDGGATVVRMTYANVGTLGTAPGRRDELVAHLTRRSPELAAAGCLLYEVGTHDDHPDTGFVAELWTSAAAHRASLELPAVQESIAAARPLLSGEFGGFDFTVAGSPLRG